MADVDDFEALIERYHGALGAIINGNPALYKDMLSTRDDVTLANPFGGVARGRTEVEARLDRAAANYRDGEIARIETVAKLVTAELAYLVELETYRAKVGGADEMSPAGLRVTLSSDQRTEPGRWSTVTQFVVGVLVGTSSAGKVRHNRLLGISSSRNQLAGFLVADAARSLVRNTSGNGSITPEGGTGIYLVASDHVRVLDSSFRNNGDRGMGVYSSAHNLIEGNRLSHNFALGILLERSDHNRVRGNRSVRDGTGVTVLHSDRNVIARNRIVHAGGRGGDGEAIQVLPAATTT
jgi:parallel beta-helix repeat protein